LVWGKKPYFAKSYLVENAEHSYLAAQFRFTAYPYYYMRQRYTNTEAKQFGTKLITGNTTHSFH